MDDDGLGAGGNNAGGKDWKSHLEQLILKVEKPLLGERKDT